MVKSLRQTLEIRTRDVVDSTIVHKYYRHILRKSTDISSNTS